MPQRIVFPEPHQVALQAFELPQLQGSDVQVRTRYSLMSTGTETTILGGRYAPDSHFARMFSFPQLKTGVQAVGEVEAIGTDVTEFRVGETVFMRMAHGSHQVLDQNLLSPVPEGVDQRSACWCGLAKTAFRAAWAARFELGLSVLVVGAGPVGQMATRWATAANVGELVVCDLSPQRLDHARRGGATDTLTGELTDHRAQLQAMAAGSGPPVVVDTTGNPDVFQQALGCLARYGKLVLLGDTGYPDRQRLTSDMMTKGLTVVATHDSHDRDGWTQRRIDELFYRSVQTGAFNLDGLITHVFSPEDCRDAYALAVDRREESMGVLFDWTGVAE